MVFNWISFTVKLPCYVELVNNCCWGHNGQNIFRVIFACGRTWYHSFRVQLVSDMHRSNKKISWNVSIYSSVIFYQIILVGISWHMKHMPVIFLFGAARDSFSNVWIFYCNPCLVIKRANAVKADIISIPPPVVN